jgi:hypothetical protein
VVGQVTREAAAHGDQGAKVGGQGVVGHDLDVRRDAAAEALREGGVDLHRHDARHAVGEGQGQRAPPRADLEEDVVRGRGDDAEEPLDRGRAGAAWRQGS